jgi:hypothetical protein
MANIKLKNLLAENMRRFGTKNLNELEGDPELLKRPGAQRKEMKAYKKAPAWAQGAAAELSVTQVQRATGRESRLDLVIMRGGGTNDIYVDNVQIAGNADGSLENRIAPGQKHNIKSWKITGNSNVITLDNGVLIKPNE